MKITQTDGVISVSAAVPGFKPEEIEVSLKDNILIMSGKTESEQRRDEEAVFYNEWRSNRFCRQLTLSSEVETGNAEADLKDGVLQLMLKKKAAEESAR